VNAPLLTFDDGPSDSTSEILDLLREHELRATFFVVGFRAEQRPDLVRRASDEGHVIGNHTWDHVNLAQLLADAENEADLRRRMETVRLKLEQGSDAIAKILGAPPTLFRAPWLSVDARVLEIANGLGLSHVHRDVDTCDYDPDHNLDYVANAILSAHSGQVVLLHDGVGEDRTSLANPPRPKTVAALGKALPEFVDRWRP
jgi:peptidoglycan-N-acetylglucosamine deacetylase